MATGNHPNEGRVKEILRQGDLTSREAKAELWRRDVSFVRSYDRALSALFLALAVLWLLPGVAHWSGWPPLSPLARLAQVNFPTPVIVAGWILVIATFALDVKLAAMRQRQGGCHDTHETVVLFRDSPYSVIRHPGYLVEMTYLGLLPVVLSRWAPFTILAAVAMGTVIAALAYLIKAEDKFNIRKWGTEYRQYMEEVPAVNFVKGLRNAASRNATTGKAARYWGHLASVYDDNALLAGPTYPPTIEKLKHEFGPADRLLDVGAGTGLLTVHVAPLVAHVTCTDIAPEMLDQARLRLQHFDHVAYRVEDATALSFEDGSFDVVLCCNVLHQMAQPEAAVREFKRVLKPGGKLLAITITMGDLAWWDRARMGIAYVVRFGIPPSTHSFTLPTFTGLVAGAGFEVQEAVQVTREPFPTAYVSAIRI